MEYIVVIGTPEVNDYIRLRHGGGLSRFTIEAAQKGLKGTLFGVQIMYDNNSVGMGRVVGDGGCFYTVVDIVIESGHRGRGLSKMIMNAIMKNLGKHADSSSYISLLADVPADNLYKQFGFQFTAPATVGMVWSPT